MNKTIIKSIKTLTLAALFIFPGFKAFPQDIQDNETAAVQNAAEENINYPILIGIP